MELKNSSLKSNFVLPEETLKIVSNLNIFRKGSEYLGDSITFLADKIYNEEREHPEWGNIDTEIEEEKLTDLVDRRIMVLGTPFLVNGIKENMPLTACILLPLTTQIILDYDKLERMVEEIHIFGHGTGFDLNECPDAGSFMLSLNNIKSRILEKYPGHRPSGVMCLIDATNPQLSNVLKVQRKAIESQTPWKLLLTVNFPNKVMEGLCKGEERMELDEKWLDIKGIFTEICESILAIGSPGIVFMERYNEDNIIPELGLYTNIPPCAELGLIDYSSNLFSYINLGSCVRKDANTDTYIIDTELIISTVGVMVRFLDNALELSIKQMPYRETEEALINRRPIAIGVCGLADLLFKLHIQYGSEEARALTTSLIMLINYRSKLESHKLSKSRGSHPGLCLQSNQYTLPGDIKNTFLVRKYGGINTQYVGQEEWDKLANEIRGGLELRNCVSVALAPAGYCSLIAGCSTSIEPYLEEVVDTDILFTQVGAMHIPWKDHLLMMRAAQDATDEAISKTVNLAPNATLPLIKEIFFEVWALGLKGIAIYVHGSRSISAACPSCK